MADNKFSPIIQKIDNDIEKINQSLIETDQHILKIVQTARANSNVFKALTPTQATQEIDKLKVVIADLNKTLQDQERQINKLNTAKKKKKQLTVEEKVEQQALNKEARLAAQANSKLVGAYANLVAQQKQAKKTLQDLIVSQGKNNVKTKQAQKEYDKLTKKVNQANKATSNFSKTGLGGMVRGFRDLLGAFGVLGGAMMFANMVKSTKDLVLELNSMDFAMKAVIKDQEEFAETTNFLTRITNAYGAELLTTTQRYTKFRAASMQAGLSAKETQDIFESMTKVSGVLGLKTDELRGVYLALEQMISKGKITTEELRRQLGERLPGAMDIMANSMGVTTAQLDEMMKKGQVITKDVLPAFAREVERAFGIENINMVDTFAASVARFDNSIINLTRSIEQDGGIISNFFIDITNVATGFITSLENLNAASDDVWTFVLNMARLAQGQGAMVAAEAEMAKAQKERERLMERAIELSEKYLTEQEKEKFNLDLMKETLNEMNNKQLKEYIENLKKRNDLENRGEGGADGSKETRQRQEYLDVTKQIIKATIEQLDQEILFGNHAEEVRNVLIGINNELKDRLKWQSQINQTPLANVDIGENDLVETGDPKGFDLDDTITSSEALLAVWSDLTSTFGEIFDIDMSKFEFLFDENINSLEEWADLSKEIISGVLDASLQRYEIELQEAQIARDLILNNELATEEEKERARRKFEEKERKIKTDKAKEERRNNLIKIAVDTAVGVVKTFAELGFTPPGILAASLLTGVGLAQAAFVASQPLPKFEGGTDNAPEGLAITQERRPEPITDKYGNIKTLGSKGGDRLTYLEKGDKVYRSQEEFFSQFTEGEIQGAIWKMNLASHGRDLSQTFVDRSLLNETKGLRKDIDAMGKQIKKLASRPISNNVTVELPDNTAY